MTTSTSHTQSSLQIPYHRLEAVNGEVFIIKNKAMLNRKFGFALLLVVLVAVLSSTLLKRSSNAFQKPMDTEAILLLSGAVLFIIVTLLFSTKRLIRVVSNVKLKKQDGLLLNGKRISSTVNRENPIVVVQNVGAAGGVGGSFTVGLSVGKKFWGLCYELDQADATKAAAFLSSHLGAEIEHREAVAFPLFKIH